MTVQVFQLDSLMGPMLALFFYSYKVKPFELEAVRSNSDAACESGLARWDYPSAA